MKIKSIVSPSLISSLLVLSASSIAGDHEHGHESHGAHVHGEAIIRLVSDNDKLTVQFESPAMNIVGFEHEPKTNEQQKTLEQALQKLNKPETLMAFTAGQCRFTSVDLDNPFGEQSEHDKHGHEEHRNDEDKHEHEHDHDEHKHAEDKHDHNEHKHAEDKHNHDEHKHDHDNSDAEHREFMVAYQVQCKKIDDLKAINFTLLNEFKGIEKLEVQYVLSGKQGAVTLNSKNTKLSIDE